MGRNKKKRRKQKPASGARRKVKRGASTERGPIDIDSELNKAIEYHESGRLRKAERAYKKILKASPGHSDCLNLLGLVAEKTGKPGKAVHLINKAILSNPNNPTYYNDLGNVLLGQGDFDEAIRCYQKVIQLDPEEQDLVGAQFNQKNSSQLCCGVTA